MTDEFKEYCLCEVLNVLPQVVNFAVSTYGVSAYEDILYYYTGLRDFEQFILDTDITSAIDAYMERR